MKIQDMADSGEIDPDPIPDGTLNSTPVMEAFEISVAGILELLKNLQPNKAVGPDRLRPLLLQELREEMAPILQVIFEHSILIGKLPADWCRAQVAPVFKKGDMSWAVNYRPISLTCILCKVLEHILASHMVKHMVKHIWSATRLQRKGVTPRETRYQDIGGCEISEVNKWRHPATGYVLIHFW